MCYLFKVTGSLSALENFQKYFEENCIFYSILSSFSYQLYTNTRIVCQWNLRRRICLRISEIKWSPLAMCVRFHWRQEGIYIHSSFIDLVRSFFGSSSLYQFQFIFLFLSLNEFLVLILVFITYHISKSFWKTWSFFLSGEFDFSP